MTTNLRLLAALGLALGLVGGVGAGVYFATAADPPQPEKKTARPAAPVADRPERVADAGQAKDKEKEKADAAAALDKPFGVALERGGVALAELFELVEDSTDLIVRVDVAAFKRLGVLGGEEGSPDTQLLLNKIYETKPVLPRKAQKMAIRDVLADALAQIDLPHPCTYQVRGSQLVVVPAYVPPLRPGVDPLTPGEEDLPVLTPRMVNEQIYGGVVSVSADKKPLSDILADLRRQTGANIVLDPRCEAEKQATLTISLGDVRLYDALRVIADLAELKMVYAGNIYYVTTPANAKSFASPKAPPPPAGGVGPGVLGPAPGFLGGGTGKP